MIDGELCGLVYYCDSRYCHQKASDLVAALVSIDEDIRIAVFDTLIGKRRIPTIDIVAKVSF